MQPAVIENEPKITENNALKRRRKRLRLSFLVAGVAIAAAVAYLVYANTQANAVYYMTVAELRHCASCATQQSVRVAGFVKPGSIVKNEQAQSVSFVITANGQSLPVTYSGIVPDIFGPNIQVVVEGHYTGQGPFNAQQLLAKCPSKFTVATPGTSQ